MKNTNSKDSNHTQHDREPETRRIPVTIIRQPQEVRSINVNIVRLPQEVRSINVSVTRSTSPQFQANAGGYEAVERILKSDSFKAE